MMRSAAAAARVVAGAPLALVALVALGPACSSSCDPPFAQCSDDSALADGGPGADGPLGYARHIAPIVDGRCARCHVDGGIAPFALTTYDEVSARLPAIRDAVVSRRMPPWLPARCCNVYNHEISLSGEQIALFTSWIDAGAPLGDVNDIGTPLPPVGSLPRVDATLTVSGPYVPDVDEHDDTRCFMLAWPFDDGATRFIVGFGVTPGQRALVHHALIVKAPASARAGYLALDDDDDAPGWSCPGGIVLGIDNLIGGWLPGSDGQEMPAGTGHRVDDGDVLVLTVHYRAAAGGAAVVADETSVDVMLADAVDDELMTISVFDPAWLAGGMPIEAADADALYRVSYDPTTLSLQPQGLGVADGSAITVVAARLHMHERGARGIVGIRRAGGADECLVQANSFDHDWEGDYQLATRTTIAPGDRVYVECHFDNTGGPALNWGDEGEMCVGFLTALKPRLPAR